MRYAIYYTPPKNAALTRRATEWLGRDAFTGETTTPLAVPPLTAGEVAFQTAAARRYGFHATMKAPFKLGAGRTERDLLGAFADFCAGARPFQVPSLTPRRLDGFIALVPSAGSPRLDAFASEVVRAFDGFRAPLSAADVARRNPERLSADQLKNLHRWGYPYVHEFFRFHMTLTGRVTEAESGKLMSAIEHHFGAVLVDPWTMGSLALFVESEPGAPFTVLSFAELGSTASRKSA